METMPRPSTTLARPGALVVIARSVIAVTLVATVIGWWQLGRLASSVEDAAGFGGETAAAVKDALGVTAELTRDVVAVAVTVDDALLQLDAVLASTIRLGADTRDVLRGELPQSLRGLSVTAGRVAQGARTLQRTIQLLPGNQNLTFADDLQELAEGLEPLPETIEGLAEPLSDAVVALGPLRTQLTDARGQLGDAQLRLNALATRMDLLSAEVGEATADLQATAERSDVRLFWWRVLLVLGALVVIGLALGLELLGRQLAVHTGDPAGEPLVD
jgi:hypothetical protein